MFHFLFKRKYDYFSPSFPINFPPCQEVYKDTVDTDLFTVDRTTNQGLYVSKLVSKKTRDIKLMEINYDFMLGALVAKHSPDRLLCVLNS